VWRKLHPDELHISPFLPDIISIINSRRMRLGRHEAHMGETINAYKVSVRNLKEVNHKKDLGVDGNKIFKWTINREGMWTGFF
jgi:hypothetical protein